ncbi:peptide-methionine (R)-S-oxide reductase MsrB [Microbulbifer sp. 2205BS26-8]|uniref:peptide-methionine (R)-S-oxide reductase MsrB n=1 Tax=Microbulbifer sp. 2205BS26-8 TaxID=3064386 RepID=UPI00273E0074|nr:peptide-methionine (R)-S-oxide reductase MsrB [Microbulbifer sp. 2205BS26-8]MDP5210036.1 peptide-methionine (R)-S-oxide reductase MsrB [Microbulbifer sp. 2205BS26-8]
MSKQKDDNYWRDKLTDEEFEVCRKGGTEAPFSGEYWDVFDRGVYRCRCCGEVLFDSGAKFESQCGWPSFDAEASRGIIRELPDNSFGMRRVEIRCRNCDSHLGHVFNDGPTDTGLRYCVNSLSVTLDKDNGEKGGEE